MRLPLVLTLLLSACSADLAGAPVTAASVHERLDERTALHIDTAEAVGTIMVERKITGGWEPTLVDLAIENGELIVSSDASDAVTIEGLQLSFAPFDVPPGIFGGDRAQLTDVRVELVGRQRVPAVWTSDNDAHLTAKLDLTLSWTLLLDDTPAPLGAPRLPQVPVEIALTGDGQHVSAGLRVDAPGEVWDWAGLLRLSALQLTLDAHL